MKLFSLLLGLMCFGCSNPSLQNKMCNSKKSYDYVQFYDKQEERQTKLIHLIVKNENQEHCKKDIQSFPSQPIIF